MPQESRECPLLRLSFCKRLVLNRYLYFFLRGFWPCKSLLTQKSWYTFCSWKKSGNVCAEWERSALLERTELEEPMDHQLQNIKDRSIKKSKNGLMKLVFGRTGVLLACLVIQLLVLLLGLRFLSQYVYVFFGGHLVFGILILVVIMNRMDNPAFQVSWAALVLLFPAFGGLLYLYIELQPGTRVLSGRIAEIEEKTSGCLKQDPQILQELQQQDPRTAQLINYIYKTEQYPVYRNGDTTYFSSGEAKFEALKTELLAAEYFIFLEYFIVSEGYMWDSIFEILKAKAKSGVEVRFLYDGMNELYNLPHDFQSQLKEAGIQCKVFSPVYPIISTHYNNRDHRKIAVIDGHTAFTGGVNLADEYINRKPRFGHWKDAAVRIRGEAVRSFTFMFLKMWDITEKIEDMSPYLEVHKIPEAQQGYVMPYPANPFGKERSAERVYLEILNNARDYVHIMTPYLVPSHEMLQALKYAAKRGVDVKLILPHIPDKKYAFALAHSYYKRLIEAGVKIYEYTPGFVHSKVFVSDDIRAVVGAINLDYRSLYLHFECAAFLYAVPEIQDVEVDFRTTLTRCQLITLFDVRHDRWTRKLAGRFLKLMAPLM